MANVKDMCALREAIKPCKSYLSLSVLPPASFLCTSYFPVVFCFCLFVCFFLGGGLFQTLIETTFLKASDYKNSTTLFFAMGQGNNRIPTVKYICYPIFNSKIGL